MGIIPSSLLQMSGIKKQFGGVYALKGVDFDLRAGEVHALLGENGAGKSTLMNILSGVFAPDAGEMLVSGQPVRFQSPREAQASGIATIYQELDLIPALSIAANLFLGHEHVDRFGRLDNRRMAEEAKERLMIVGLDRLDPRCLVRDLGIGQRQLVAIAKALSFADRVLVMDEPTAALSAGETERLFEVVRGLASRNVGIVYISHRLEEVPVIADRVTVMRDGRVVGETAATAPQAELVHLLVGRPLTELYPPRTGKSGEELLRLEDACFSSKRTPSGWQPPQSVTLSVHAGEIVGLAGIMGAGRTELLCSLYGSGPSGRWRGVVNVAGKPAHLSSVRSAQKSGLAFVTDDRRGSGLMLRQSIGRNVVMSVIRRISPFGLLSQKREQDAVNQSMKRFDIRPRRAHLAVGNLSGGNQQKVVFAKELLASPHLLLLDEPTRGVDVGAKGEIYQRLRELTDKGLGVLVASSELPELIGLCDRIVVMREGRSVATFSDVFDEKKIMKCAAGERGENGQ